MRFPDPLLRALDLLGVSLIGIGLLCVVLGSVVAFEWGATPLAHGKHTGNWLVCYAVVAVSATSLGAALAVAVRRVRRRGGREALCSLGRRRR